MDSTSKARQWEEKTAELFLQILSDFYVIDEDSEEVVKSRALRLIQEQDLYTEAYETGYSDGVHDGNS